MRKNEIYVRTMTDADVDRVAILSSQLGYPSSVEDIAVRWRQISASSCEIIFVIDLRDRHTVGFAHVGIELGLTNPSRAIIRSFIIDQSLRNLGLGTEFLLTIEDEMRRRGFSKIRVGSQVKRADAHRFYQRTGYDLLKIWNVFEKKLN